MPKSETYIIAKTSTNCFAFFMFKVKFFSEIYDLLKN